MSDTSGCPAPLQSIPTPPTETPPATTEPENLMLVETLSIGPSQRAVQVPQASHPTKKNKLHVKANLVGEIEITFNGPEERLRATQKLLPAFGFRTSYEGSGTLNRYQPEECYTKNRDNPHLKLAGGNTFQNIGDFNPWHDMVPSRITRHYHPQMFRNPSPFVSAYHSINDAIEKAGKQYNISRKVGHRVTVTQINYRGLVPATMHCTMESAMVFFQGDTLTSMEHTQKTRRGKWPVWVRDTARPSDGSPISMQQLLDSGADMWLRGIELRKTGPYDMNCGAADTHDNEWLCCGPVPNSIIMRVMPYDGEKLHKHKSSETVLSTQSIETYVFNWDKWEWEHNPSMTDFRPYRMERPGDKRRPSNTETGGQDSAEDSSSDDGLSASEKRRHNNRRRRVQILRLARQPALALSASTVLANIPPSAPSQMVAY